MTLRTSTRSAPGKVILFGEHAVGYGRPAIATPIDRGLTLTATLRDGEPGTRDGEPGTPVVGPPSEDARRLAAALGTAAACFSLAPHRIALGIVSDLPARCGLGSSAALSVTLLRALADLCRGALGRAELLERAGAVEAAFHGTSSGLDVAAVGLGGTVWFQRTASPRATLLPVGRAFDLVVATTARRRSTAHQVSEVRRCAQDRPDVLDRHFTRLGGLAAAGREALRTGDLTALGVLLDEAQEPLADLGLSTPALDRAIATARTAGALGAKLTGAGGGGAVVALAPGNAPAVAAVLRAAGYGAFVSHVDAARPSDCPGTS
ncbi:mevalonate kinase [Kitasatospora sp. NPDC056783]|uniref:mevalonate kinase n=1 Tax=Kitasatospora sp. NPDC056783 TaxID=3345943 RepID=UPI0036C133E6